MSKQIITSPIGNQFHPMISAVIVMLSIPLWAVENFIIAAAMIAFAILLAWKDKIVKVDIEQQKYKEGWFSSWKVLDKEGYISVFPERESQIMRSRVSEGSFTTHSAYVNYIQGREKIHLFKGSSREEVTKIALKLNAQWNCGVYDGVDKVWLVEKRG